MTSTQRKEQAADDAFNTPELTVIVLVYNESSNLPHCFRLIEAWAKLARIAGIEVLFVDDASSDASASMCERTVALWHSDPELKTVLHARLVRRTQNGGIGAALRTGVTEATGRWVSFLPADGQVSPFALTTLYRATQMPAQGPATNTRDGAGKGATVAPALVLSVYSDRQDGAVRRLLSSGVRALITALYARRLRSDGPYLFRRELFDPAELVSESFFLNFEFPLRALRGGVPFSVVSVHCATRLFGNSKSAGWRTTARVAKDLAYLRLHLLRGQKWLQPPRGGETTDASAAPSFEHGSK